jgi:hypothetical protein
MGGQVIFMLPPFVLYGQSLLKYAGRTKITLPPVTRQGRGHLRAEVGGPALELDEHGLAARGLV